MFDHRCYVVPPYLLRAISESDHNPEPIRKAAEDTLTRRIKISSSLHDRSKALTHNAGVKKSSRQLSKPSIVSADLLRHLANSKDVDEKVRKCADRDLRHLRAVHERVLTTQEGNQPLSPLLGFSVLIITTLTRRPRDRRFLQPQENCGGGRRQKERPYLLPRSLRRSEFICRVLASWRACSN